MAIAIAVKLYPMGEKATVQKIVEDRTLKDFCIPAEIFILPPADGSLPYINSKLHHPF
jgi:hypothetical protein